MSSVSNVPHHMFDLKQYHINCETGFMLRDPLRTLPAYFEPWNELAKSLPTLITERKFRQAVDQLPLLDHTRLIGHRQQRLAHLQLSLITSGYVSQDAQAEVVLPKCVAVPYCKISDELGVKPILGFVDAGLANYAFIDPKGPHVFENLECIYHLPDKTTGDWFLIVAHMMELNFAKCLKSITRILESLSSANLTSGIKDAPKKTFEKEIISCLQNVSACTKDMKFSLSRMPDHLDARAFFNVIRPFFDGWDGGRKSHPNGLIYEGISDRPVKLIGGSGAQSGTLQVLDCLLGVQHRDDKRRFLLEMRNYMLPSHRHFIEDIEQFPYPLRDFEDFGDLCNEQCLYLPVPPPALADIAINNLEKYFGYWRLYGLNKISSWDLLVDALQKTPGTILLDISRVNKVTSSNNHILKSTYNQCLLALKELRDYHIQLVKMYVIIPSRKVNEKVSESLDKRGTGGTNLIPFLGDIRSATSEKLIPVVKQAVNAREKKWNVVTPTVRFCLTAIILAVVGFYTRTLF